MWYACVFEEVRGLIAKRVRVRDLSDPSDLRCGNHKSCDFFKRNTQTKRTKPTRIAMPIASLAGEKFLNVMHRQLSARGCDRFGQWDIFRANFHTVLGIAAIADATDFGKRVESFVF